MVIFDNTDFAPKENANGTPSNIILLKYEKINLKPSFNPTLEQNQFWYS